MEEFYVNSCPISGKEAKRETAKKHFKILYQEAFEQRPILDNMHFNKIEEADRSILEAELSGEKIFDCLKKCDGDKAPRPDGFNLKFFQEFWYVIKKKMCLISLRIFTRTDHLLN